MLNFKDTYIGWDTETDLIGLDAIAPDLICSTFYGLESKQGHLDHWHPREDCSANIRWAFSEDRHVIGHNTAYDTLVAAKFDPTLLPVLWKAYKEDRVHDTMIREMLLNLATIGSIDDTSAHGLDRQIGYTLADLVYLYTGEDISAEKDDEDSVRVNYAIVKDERLEDWPDEFKTYALDDPKHTGIVFLAQEVKRQRIIDERGFDPLAIEGFRTMIAFALALMTAQGNELDPDEVLRVTEEFQTMYNEPALVEPLYTAGFYVRAQPAQPNKRGTQDHTEECWGHKDHLKHKAYLKERNASKKRGDGADICGCPVKTNKPKKETRSDAAIHDYIWNLARRNPLVKVWAADGLLDQIKEEGLKDDVIQGERTINWEFVEHMAKEQAELSDAHAATFDVTARPDKWRLQVNKAWLANYASLDPILEKYAERKRIEKIVTSYLPKLYWADGYHNCPEQLEGAESKFEGKRPADRVHSGFSPLKETGRCSSRAASRGKGQNTVVLYPSWNGQQVDPRVRGCVVADGYLDNLRVTGNEEGHVDLDSYEGNVLFSLDYSAMELGTAAQVAYNILGYSVLADKINAGVDTHAYLGAQIAHELDPCFASACGSADNDKVAENFFELKKYDEPCDSPTFTKVYRDSHPDSEEPPKWSDFFKHYRKFAKPTGLGYPGGLGPATFTTYAKGTYGVTVDLETATLLREVWRSTYPELPEYLNYVNKHCVDEWAEPDYQEQEDGSYKKRSWYAYTTPMGMVRARCSYTACANGQALQSPSAEGALGAVCEIMEQCTIGELAGHVFPSIFIHDEVFGEMEWKKGGVGDWLGVMDEIMVRRMRAVTPDVRAATEAVVMFRWNKFAEPKEEGGILVPWDLKKVEK